MMRKLKEGVFLRVYIELYYSFNFVFTNQMALNAHKRGEKVVIEENFRNILDNMMEGFQVIDYKWRYIYVNDAVAKHGHTTKEKLLGKTMMEAYPGIEKTKMFSVLTRCMKERVPAYIENEFSYPNGEKGWFELSIQPVPEGIFILSIDISERKKAEEKLKQSEERHRTLFENTGTAMCIIEEDKTLSLVNREFEKLLGYSQEELKGKKWTEFVTKEHLDRMKKYHEARRKKGETPPKQYTFDFVNKNGQIRNAMLTIDMIPGTKKSVASILDITELKEAEKALLEAEEKYRETIVSANVGIIGYGHEGEVKVLNPKMEQMTGFKRSEIPTLQDWFEKLYPNEEERRKIRDRWLKRMSEEGEIKEGHAIITTKDGKRRNFLFNGVRLESGESVAFAEDITERKKAEEALREAKEKFETYLNLARVIMLAIDAEGIVTYVNKRGCEVLGYKENEIVGKDWFSNFLPERIAKKIKQYAKDLLSGQTKPVEYYENPVLSKSGEERIIEWYNILLRDKKGEIMSTLSSGKDITERKRMEQQLKESEEKYRKQFEAALDAIFLGDAETGILVDCNRAATKLVGRKKSELIGKHQRILHPPKKLKGKFTKSFEKHRKEKEGQVLEDQIITKNGEIRDVLINATSFELEDKRLLQGVFRDITELKRAEQEMRELAYKLNEITPGECYISESEEKLMKVFIYSVVHGRSGLCVTRKNPAALTQKYSIKPEHVRLLSSTPIRDFQVLKNLQEVSLEMSKFLKKGNGIMLLDDLEYLVSRFGFNPVYNMLQEKRYDFLNAGAVLLIPVNFEALTNQEKALLASEFKTIK
jgi:PAS domain S-box-containing protein